MTIEVAVIVWFTISVLLSFVLEVRWKFESAWGYLVTMLLVLLWPLAICFILSCFPVLVGSLLGEAFKSLTEDAKKNTKNNRSTRVAVPRQDSTP